MSVKTISKDELRRMEGSEGLIIQGCGGSLDEWVDGINDMLTEDGILLDGTRFHDCSTFEHDGSTCLLFPFKDDVKLDVGRLAMWRLQTHGNFGGTWLSDYVPNRLGGFISKEQTAETAPKPRLSADRSGRQHLQSDGYRIPHFEAERPCRSGKGDVRPHP